MSDVLSKVKKIVADHLGIDEAKVLEESSFIDDLGADSLDTVELVMAFEEEFGSEISDNEAEKILTAGDALKFIESIKSVLTSRIPMSKLGTGEDVSNTVAFLSSESASYITGETIHVNGGMYMAWQSWVIIY